MEWTAAETLLALLDGEARRLLFALLRAPSEERAAAIGYAYAHPDGATAAELLILLEERDWARHWLIERLSGDTPRSDS